LVLDSCHLCPRLRTIRLAPPMKQNFWLKKSFSWLPRKRLFVAGSCAQLRALPCAPPRPRVVWRCQSLILATGERPPASDRRPEASPSANLQALFIDDGSIGNSIARLLASDGFSQRWRRAFPHCCVMECAGRWPRSMRQWGLRGHVHEAAATA
jgi:hypothetical protein